MLRSRPNASSIFIEGTLSDRESASLVCTGPDQNPRKLFGAYGGLRSERKTEGELYNLEEDPGQLVNLWNDPAYAAVKAEMIETIRKDLLARPMFHNHPIPGALI